MFFVALQQCRLCEQYDQTQNCTCALFERLHVSRNEATIDNDLCETIPRNCDAHCFASIPGSWQSLCRVLRGERGDNEGLCEVLLRIELIVAIQCASQLRVIVSHSALSTVLQLADIPPPRLAQWNADSH